MKPDPFSWLTYGAASAMKRACRRNRARSRNVEDAGPDFMQVVFSQPEKGITVAFNNPQSIAYVIQVSEFEPGTEVLRRSFLAADYRTYARVLQPQQQRRIMEWNQMIQNEAGLKWLHSPTRGTGRRKENGGLIASFLHSKVRPNERRPGRRPNVPDQNTAPLGGNGDKCSGA